MSEDVLKKRPMNTTIENTNNSRSQTASKNEVSVKINIGRRVVVPTSNFEQQRDVEPLRGYLSTQDLQSLISSHKSKKNAG